MVLAAVAAQELVQADRVLLVAMVQLAQLEAAVAVIMDPMMFLLVMVVMAMQITLLVAAVAEEMIGMVAMHRVLH